MKEEKKKKKQSNIKSIVKQLYHSERGRAFLFFGFYAIFFAFVIVLVRSSHSIASVEKKEEPKKFSEQYELSLLEKKNYHYKYLITIGEEVFFYEGDCFKSTEQFYFMTLGKKIAYYRDGTIFIKNENNIWNVADNPYYLKEFYEIENISAILEEATFISKTEYESGRSELKFQIATEQLMKIFKSNLPMTVEGENEIILFLKKDKSIEKIEYNVTNYYTNVTGTPYQTTLELNYSNFGQIKEIEKP